VPEVILILEPLMSLKQLSIRLEVSFWQLVIQLLSESRAVQAIITWIYHHGVPATTGFFHNLEVERALRWAAVGLALGFLTGLLSVLI
jgi:uncharacterized paraquat-inducible protein A